MISNQISIMTEEHLDDAVFLVLDELQDMFMEDAGDGKTISTLDEVDEEAVELAAEQVGVAATPQLVSVVMARIDRLG